MNRSLTGYLAPVLTSLMLTTATVAAIAQAPATPPASLNFQQVIDRVVAQGYSDVREVERKSDKLYEIEARDGKRRWVELYVDSCSGEILREEVK